MHWIFKSRLPVVKKCFEKPDSDAPFTAVIFQRYQISWILLSFWEATKVGKKWAMNQKSFLRLSTANKQISLFKISQSLWYFSEAFTTSIFKAPLDDCFCIKCLECIDHKLKIPEVTAICVFLIHFLLLTEKMHNSK